MITFSDVAEGAAPRRDRMLTVTVHPAQPREGDRCPAEVMISFAEPGSMTPAHVRAIGQVLDELAVIVGGTLDRGRQHERRSWQDVAQKFGDSTAAGLWLPLPPITYEMPEFLELVPSWFMFRRTKPAARRLIGDVLRSGAMSSEGRLVLLVSALEALWVAGSGQKLRQRKDVSLRHKLAELADTAVDDQTCPKGANPEEQLPQGASQWAADLVSVKNHLAHSGRTGPSTPAQLEELAWRSCAVLRRALLQHLR
ncbi:hypothetical protein [Nesterenkonia suensis]